MPNEKLIAAVVHDLVAARRFYGWADLTDAVKARCAQLRIPYDSQSVTDAVSLVARRRPVFVDDRDHGGPRP
jgi:hypothetical protein